MNLEAVMAWRNLWRNARRTLGILAAIVIGVWSMILLGALMRGMMVQMAHNGIITLTGHIQAHHQGYHADPVIGNSMTNPEEVEAALAKALPAGSHWAGRVWVNAVASNAHHPAGVTLVGIEPQREARGSFIADAITHGKYLAPQDDRGIVVGAKFLDEYDTKEGFKVILMPQDEHKQIAPRAFRIQGASRAEMEATEQGHVFVTK
ncbi:MAG: ABC transporter permease [Pseudomonadota bacterium]